MIPLLLAGLGSLLGGAFGSKKVSEVPYKNEMEQLLQQQLQQMQQSQPLNEALQRWAMGLVPTYARQPPPAASPGGAMPRPGLMGHLDSVRNKVRPGPFTG